MPRLMITTAFAFATLASFAAIPVRWSADAARAKPLVYDCYHGETLDLAASMTAYGTPLDFAGKTARLYWQTNGMDAAWWSTNAEVRAEGGVTNVLAAVWSGAFDTGADAVTGFIGLEGENYRASFALRFRASPGFAPSTLPIPVKSIDWAEVSNENADSAPFVVKGGEGCVSASQVTNISARVTSNVVTKAYVEGLGVSAPNYAAVSNAAMSAAAATNEFLRAAATNGLATVAEVAVKRDLTDSVCVAGFAKWFDDDGVEFRWYPMPNEYGSARWSNGDGYFLYQPGHAGDVDYLIPKNWDGNAAVGFPYDVYVCDAKKIPIACSNDTYATYIAVTNAISTLSPAPDFTTNNAALVATVTNSAASKSVEGTVADWENYWHGDRVRLSVTNYYGNASGEPPRLRIEEFDHSTTNGTVVSNYYHTVWDELTRQTNYQAQVDAKVDAVSNSVMIATWRQTNNQLANKAPRAWQSVTSAGEAAPDNTVWHTAPNTVFAGGTEYAHVAVGEGTICVLVDQGAPVFTEGAEGQFRFTDETGENYFGFDVRSAYTIGCRTDGIEVDTANHLVSLTFDLTASSNPTILHCTNLTENVWEEQAVTWEQNPPAGSMICDIDVGTAPSGFYKAQIEYAGGAKFLTNMQADLAGGIAATNEVSNIIQSIYPVITSTGVVWRVKQ